MSEGVGHEYVTAGTTVEVLVGATVWILVEVTVGVLVDAVDDLLDGGRLSADEAGLRAGAGLGVGDADPSDSGDRVSEDRGISDGPFAAAGPAFDESGSTDDPAVEVVLSAGVAVGRP